VQTIDGMNMTVAAQSGQLTAVTLSATTRLHKATPAALADVAAGEQVTIAGQANADGSITAVAVQVSPAGS
jgi:hypothetical protein